MKFRLCPLGRGGRWVMYLRLDPTVYWRQLGIPGDKTDLMVLLFYALRGGR